MSKVQKAYLIDINPFCQGHVRHVLVGEHNVFVPTSGWHGRKSIEENYKLVIFPKFIEKPDWPRETWETVNAKLYECFAWCYKTWIKRPPDFRFCHTSEGCIYAG